MPDYSHLTRMVVTAGECVLEEVEKDARLLLSAPTERDLLSYCVELDNIVEILMFHVDALQELRIQARTELKLLAMRAAS